MTSRVKKRISLLLGAFVLLAGSVGGAYAIKRAHTNALMAEWLRDGMEAYKAKDYQRTMDKLSKYAGRDRTRADVILALADARRCTPMENSRHITEAIRFARFAADLSPADPAPREMLLDLYGKAGFATERLQVADWLLAAQPGHHDAMQAKMECLVRLGKISEARDVAVAMAQAYPKEVTVHLQAIDLMSRLREDPMTIRAFADNAAAALPDNQRFVILQAQAHGMSGDVAGAIKLLKQAAEMDVQSAEALDNLLGILDLMSRSDPAMAALADSSLERAMNGPLSRDAAAVAAERCWKAGHPAAARAYAAKAVDPSNLSAATADGLGWWTFLGVASGKHLDDPEIAPALADLRERGDAPAMFWAEMIQGTADINADHLQDATQHLARARAADHMNDIPDFLMSDVKQRQGEWRQAVTAMERLSKEQPFWRTVRISLITLLLDHGQPDDAVHQAELAISIRPAMVEGVALVRAFAMLLETGHAKPQQVQLALELAGDLDPQTKSDPLAQSMIARIYLAADMPDKGLAIIRAMMATTPAPPAPVLASLSEPARRYDGALADQLLAAATSVGKSPDITLQAALQAAASGKPDQGRSLLAQAIEAHPGPQRLAYELRMAVYLDRINDPAAAGEFAKLASAHDDNAAVQLTVLDSDAAWKDEALVTDAIGRLHRLTGDSAFAWKNYEARRLMTFSPSQSRAAQAIQLLADVIRQDRSNVGALILSAQAHGLLGDRGKAIELLAKAVDAEPDSVSLYPPLIELLQQSGAAEEAEHRLQAFCRLKPLPQDTLRRRAKLLAAQGMWDQAAEDFEQLAAAGGLEDRFAYAVVLSRRGDAAAAREKMEAILGAPGLSEPMVIAIANYFGEQGDVDHGRGVLESHLPPEASARRAGILAAYYERFSRFDQAAPLYVKQAEDAKPESLAELARFYLKRGRLDDAASVVDRGLAASPGNPSLQQVSAFIRLAKGGSSREALADLAASVDSMDPASPLKQVTQAVQELERNPKESAAYIAKLEEITKANPGFFPAWRLLVDARLKRGEAKEATDAARIAARTSPIDPRPARLAAEAMNAVGMYDEALVMAQQWRQRSNADPFEADMGIAVIEGALKRFDDAVKRLDLWKARLIAEADAAPEHLQVYAGLLASAGRVQDAQDLVWPLADKSPSWAMRCLSIASEMSGPVQDQWIARMTPLLDKSPAGHLALGRVLFQVALRERNTARFQRAVDTLTGALNDQAFRAPAAILLAACHQNLGNRGEAIRYYRMAIEADPTDATALNNLAFILAEDPATAAEAVPLAQKAVDLAEGQNSPAGLRRAFMDTLGVAQLRCGRFKEAEDTFRKGIELGPGTFDLNVGLAEATLAQGNSDTARSVIQLWDAGAAPRDPALEKRISILRGSLKDAK
jgi:tetratricopeptide (TPR) repeat protein